MQIVHLSDSKKLRFPARCEDFVQGVEIGIVAALMDVPLIIFIKKISAANLDQVEALAEKMGYEIEAGHQEEDWVELTFRHIASQPRRAQRRLKLVHSA